MIFYFFLKFNELQTFRNFVNSVLVIIIMRLLKKKRNKLLIRPNKTKNISKFEILFFYHKTVCFKLKKIFKKIYTQKGH